MNEFIKSNTHVNETILNHLNPVFDHISGLEPTLKNYKFTFIHNGDKSERNLRAYSYREATTNLAKFYPGNLQILGCKETVCEETI